MGKNNYCIKCGEPLEQGANFCGNCGHKIKADNNESAENRGGDNTPGNNEENKKSSSEEVDTNKASRNIKEGTRSDNKEIEANETDEYRQDSNNSSANNDKTLSEDILKSKVEDNNSSNGFSKIWGHIGIGLISLILLLVGIGMTLTFLDGAFGYYTPMAVEIIGTVLVGFLVGAFLVMIISVYATKFNLLVYNKDEIGWSDIFLKKVKFFKNLGSFIGAFFIMTLIDFGILLGFIWMGFEAGPESFGFIQFLNGVVLLIVNSRLILSPFVVFDQNKRAFAAIKKSIAMTKNNTLKIIGWMILISIINSIGGAVYIGVVVSFPLSIYLLTKVYYDLKSPQELTEYNTAYDNKVS